MTENDSTILIVDDEAAIRRLLIEELSSQGFHCREANGYTQALAILRDNSVALAILDIRMPGKSGVELLAEMRASYPDTAVIMATANIDTSTAVQCMKQGAYDYVTKPFSLDEVVISANRALEKRRLEL